MQANQKISKDKGVRQRNLSGALFLYRIFRRCVWDGNLMICHWKRRSRISMM